MARRNDRNRPHVPSTAGAMLRLEGGKLKPVGGPENMETGAHASRTGLEIALRVSGLGIEEYRNAIKDMSLRHGFRALLPAAGVVIVDANRTSPVLDRMAKYLKEDDLYGYSWGGGSAKIKSDQVYRYRAETAIKGRVTSAWNQRSAFHIGSGADVRVALPVLGEPGLRTVDMDRSGKGTEVRVNVDFRPVDRQLRNVLRHLFGPEAIDDGLPVTRELTLATLGLKYAEAKDMLQQEGLMPPETVNVGPPEFTTIDL